MKKKDGIQMEFEKFHKFWQNVCNTEINIDELHKTIRQCISAKYKIRDLVELNEEYCSNKWIILNCSKSEKHEYSYLVYNPMMGDYEYGQKMEKLKWVKQDCIKGHVKDLEYLRHLQSIHA